MVLATSSQSTKKSRAGRVDEREPGQVRRSGRVDERRCEQGATERVGGDDVEASVAHDGRCAGHGVEEALHAWPHLLLGSVVGAGVVDGVVRGAGQVEQVGAFGFVELQGTGDGFEDAVGDTGEVAALEPGVVVDADPGEHGDLLAAQARHPPVGAVGRQSDVLWGDAGAAGGEELAHVVPVDHADHATTGPSRAWGVLSLPGTPCPSRLRVGAGWLAVMTDKKIWFVTGAARGMGVDIATAALAAGHAVVATARNADAVTAALGEHDDLLAVQLDITDPASVDAAVAAAVDRFGRIDVLVNNAGNFYAGYFEEISPAQMRAQIETNLFGPMNVTRAVLPVMRRQRSGHIVTISSTAGLIGQEFVAAYAASKFGVEGWMESLRFDVEPFGIHTTVVEPGFFRTELLVEGSSTIWPELSIDDYADRTTSTIAAWRGMNGQQGGDPAKLAAALVTITALDDPPQRFVAGADAVAAVEQKAHDLLAQIDAHRDLSTNLAHDDVPA